MGRCVAAQTGDVDGATDGRPHVDTESGTGVDVGGSGDAATRSDGSGGATAGMAGRSGTDGSGNGGSAPPPPQATYELLDNLEDGDDRIVNAAGHQGPWHSFNSGGGNQQPSAYGPFKPEIGGFGSSMYAVHTTGDGYQYAGVGFDLNNASTTPESAMSQSFDASGFDGIVFVAKGTGKLRIELPMKSFVPFDRGGSCTNDCWNVYGNRDAAGALTADWKEYKIPFSGLVREAGGTSPPFGANQLMGVAFKNFETGHFDFWVDDVRFYKDPVGAGGAGGAGGNATTCSPLPPVIGTGSFTWYYFGQGSFREGSGFRTACGYYGSESGQIDTVENVTTGGGTYFAAIPGMSSVNFETNKYCGACVEISNGGKTIVATVIDQCPQDSNPVCRGNPSGHLDLSKAAFDALSFSTGNPSGTSWRFVPCPMPGTIVVRIKPGNPDQVFIENVVLPLQSVSMNGQQASHLFYGAWQLPGNAAGAMLTLTDISGRSVMVQVSGGDGQNQNTGKQFPTCN